MVRKETKTALIQVKLKGGHKTFDAVLMALIGPQIPPEAIQDEAVKPG